MYLICRKGILVCFLLALLLSGVSAQELGAASETASGADQVRGLSTFDWILIVLYSLGMVWLGLRFAGRQQNTKDYFLAGGKMGSFAVGISIYATLLSTITYLSVPGEMIKSGPVVLCSIFAYPIAFVTVGYWLIPAIMKHRVTSAYELLEKHLGLGARLFGATLFVAMRLVWMGLMLNICAEALVAMLGLPQTAQPYIVLIGGFVAISYTVLGGLKAVIITDMVQFLLLFGGALLTTILVTLSMDGFGWFPTQWAPHWDSQPLYSFDPHVRVTVVSSILSQAIWWICTAGSDQTTIQRYMATPDVQTARRSFLVNACAAVSLSVVLGLVGLSLLGFYMSNSQLIPAGETIRDSADQLFPRYIANQLPVGISGLVVVALFAAVMSSLDSGVNAVTAVVVKDFVGPFRRRPIDPRRELRFSRVLTLAIGASIVVLNVVVDQVPGNYLEVTSKTTNLLVAPLFGLFFMALFVRWATPFGAIFGSIYGVTAAILVAFWDLITGLDPLSFQWIVPGALAVNIVAGLLLCALPTRGRSKLALTGWSLAASIPVVVALAVAIALGQ